MKKNIREQKVRERAEQKGWCVLRNGWPDFLLYNYETQKAIALEVKSVEDPRNVEKQLSCEQKKMHDVLRRLGIPVLVVFASDKNDQLFITTQNGILPEIPSPKA